MIILFDKYHLPHGIDQQESHNIGPMANRNTNQVMRYIEVLWHLHFQTRRWGVKSVFINYRYKSSPKRKNGIIKCVKISI